MGFHVQLEKYVILDIVRGQWAQEVKEDRIEAVAEDDGYHVVVFVEQEPGAGGKESAETTMHKTLINYATEADKVTASKEKRAHPFAVVVNKGAVLMVRAGWNKNFVEELRRFPRSDPKDQVDAAGGAYAKVGTRRQIKTLVGL